MIFTLVTVSEIEYMPPIPFSVALKSPGSHHSPVSSRSSCTSASNSLILAAFDPRLGGPPSSILFSSSTILFLASICTR